MRKGTKKSAREGKKEASRRKVFKMVEKKLISTVFFCFHCSRKKSKNVRIRAG